MGKKSSNSEQALWIALGTIGQILLSLVSAMVLSRYFNKTDYGTYKQILFTYSSLLVVFNAGLPKVFAYYLPNYSKEEGKHIVSKVTWLLVFAGVLFSVLLFFGAGLIADILKNPALESGLKLFAIVPTLLLPTLSLKGILSSYKLTQYIAIYMALSKLVLLVCIVAPVIFIENSLQSAIGGWIVASLVSLILAFVLNRIPFKGIKRKQTSLSTSTILKYSVPIVYASLAGVAIKAADQFYISRYFGPEVFAEFSNGFMNLPFVGFITGAASLVLMPVFSKLIKNNIDHNELLVLWNNTLYKSALLIFPLTLFFIFFAEPIVLLLFGEKYFNSILYFQIASFLNFFKIILFAPLILSLGESGFYANAHILMAILAWVGGFIIIQFFPSPINVAFLSTVNAIILIFLVLNHAGKKLNANIFQMIPIAKLTKLTLHSLFVIGLTYLLFTNVLTLNNKILLLISAASFFAIVLLVSAKFLKINYLLAVKPILKKLPIPKSIIDAL